MARAIIADLGTGNLFSVAKAFGQFGVVASITEDPSDLDKNDALILPGVGSFASTIETLWKSGWAERVKAWHEASRPLLGICLGMQLMFDSSSEHGFNEGLGLFSGSVTHLRDQLPHSHKVPTVGWYALHANLSHAEHDDLAQAIDGRRAYFTHSYAILARGDPAELAHAEYSGKRIIAGVRKGSTWAFQFHPEKSADAGLHIYRRFVNSYLRSR